MVVVVLVGTGKPFDEVGRTLVEMLTPQEVPVVQSSDGTPPPGLYDRILFEVERPLIRLTLAATRGNQVRAAEILGLNRNTLRKKIHDLGVEMTRGRR